MNAHFDNCEQDFQEVVEKVRDDLIVDDLVTEGEYIKEFKKSKPDSSVYSCNGVLSCISNITTKKY